jgi:hypothetical protein
VEESEVDAEQLAEAASAGRQNLGSPLSTFWDGAKGELQDGFGRCSPGRWHPSTRGLTMKTEEAAFCKPLSAVVDKQVAILFPGSGGCGSRLPAFFFVCDVSDSSGYG